MAMTTNEEQIFALLDELEAHFAYDMGATDSGVRDYIRRNAILKDIKSFSDKDVTRCLSLWIANRYLSEDALGVGFSWEDAREFLSWWLELY